MQMLPKSASSVAVSLDGVHTKRLAGASLQQNRLFVPVIGIDRKPLMPTTSWRAAQLIKTKKATPFFSKGVFCVRMNVTTKTNKQPVACGIDPGSKKEGFTVKSAEHTYLNVNADAVTWVKDVVETRRNMRRSRRFRKTPCRSNRFNRARGCLPPSTKARWQWKLRLANWLIKIYPIECFEIEDVAATTKEGQKKWNKSFSPLEVGKFWFYGELSKIGKVITKSGYETKELRDRLSLKKTKSKLENVFSAHCVDSWVLANSYVGGDILDNKNIIIVTPLQFHRRQLHVLQPHSGIRKPYGGTRSLGFKRGSIVVHPKHGKVYVGGMSNNRISLHSVETGERLCRNAKVEDCRFLTFNSWRMAIPPTAKAVGSLAI
jgi:hypothetical protein